MKRKAILIGNTRGLPGVQIDINRFTTFLKSNRGGAWYDSEIEILQNDSKNSLLQKIDAIRKQSFDYVTVLFSGHGGHEKIRQTVLEINGAGEKIEETALRRLAQRQLNIYDCCRCYSQRSVTAESYAMDSALVKSASNVRQRYDDRIMQAMPQQALLYSCSVGQGSWDTSEGGVYFGNFLKAANLFSPGENFKLVGIAHQAASQLTIDYCEKENLEPQNPQAFLQKCLSSEQLVVSMNA